MTGPFFSELGGASPYEVLGVGQAATDREIREARRRLLRTHHPDRPGGDPSTAQLINASAALLLDTVRRQRYDDTVATPVAPPVPRAPRGYSAFDDPLWSGSASGVGPRLGDPRQAPPMSFPTYQPPRHVYRPPPVYYYHPPRTVYRPPPRLPYNGFALAAFWTSIGATPVAFLLAIVALFVTRPTRERGIGLALTSFVVNGSLMGLVVWAIAQST